jgi:hypothetical protein
MSIGQSIGLALLVTQGRVGYYNTAVRIDGVTVTPRWQGGAAPVLGNALGIESYNYNIIKTAQATYTVLASRTQFA